MKKVEFPTLLNEQPTVIFGRTGREMVIMACGIAVGYRIWTLWDAGGAMGTVIQLLLSALPVVASILVAVIPIASRPIEEWFFILLLYLFVPKLYQFTLLESDEATDKTMTPALRDRFVAALQKDDEDD